MGFLSLFTGRDSGNEVSTTSNSFLRAPGDHAEARITPSNRLVMKASRDNGNEKISETRYSNGTVVRTYSSKNK